MDTHAGFIKELLTSWTPQHSEPRLRFCPYREEKFTRQGFVDVLRSLGTIAEEWLQTVEEQASEGDSRMDHDVQYQLFVDIYDWEAQREWWLDHLISCFPTWLDLKRLNWTFNSRKCIASSVLIAANLTL